MCSNFHCWRYFPRPGLSSPSSCQPRTPRCNTWERISAKRLKIRWFLRWNKWMHPLQGRASRLHELEINRYKYTYFSRILDSDLILRAKLTEKYVKSFLVQRSLCSLKSGEVELHTSKVAKKSFFIFEISFTLKLLSFNALWPDLTSLPFRWMISSLF